MSNLDPLAQALGLPAELLERAAAELHADREIARFANRVLAPHMTEASACYRRKGERLLEAVYRARGHHP